MSIEQIAEYYSTLNYEGDIGHEGSLNSLFIGSSVRNVAKGLKHLLSNGILQYGSKFLDAGSGDGRIVAAAAELGFDAYGIEWHEDACAISQQALLNLGFPAKIAFGDFTCDTSYESFGGFQSFDIIFNYMNGEQQISKKIANESSFGTVFLYYTFHGQANFMHLTQKEFKKLPKIELTDCEISGIRIQERESAKGFMFPYVKLN